MVTAPPPGGQVATCGTRPSIPPRAAGPVPLTDEQRSVAEALVRGVKTRPLQTLGGYAGTGKTTIISAIANRLPGFGVCAFTGKAADVLRRKGLHDASTIHGLIYRPEQTSRGVTWRLKSPAELGVRGFVVDEASMVAAPLFRDLASFGLPVVAVGDHGQLEPVGEDAGLMRSPDYRLETVHRNAGPIARFAEHLRKGGDARRWTPEAGVYLFDRSQVTDDFVSRADQVICAFNRTRVGLNRTVRRFLDRPDGNTPEAGDRVMCLRNDRTAGVFNGMQGVIRTIDRKDRVMLFAPTYGAEMWVHYHPDSWNADRPPQDDRRGGPGRDIPFDFAWAVTAHKSQGDEWNKVIVFEERCGYWEHARWAYTAASRAKEVLVWVAG